MRVIATDTGFLNTPVMVQRPKGPKRTRAIKIGDIFDWTREYLPKWLKEYEEPAPPPIAVKKQRGAAKVLEEPAETPAKEAKTFSELMAANCKQMPDGGGAL